MTPSMAKLRRFVTCEQMMRDDFDHLVATIGSNDMKVPENARICACFLLASFDTAYFDVTSVAKLNQIITEGAENNFSKAEIAKTNIRAYFVDMRVQVLLLLAKHDLATFATVIAAFGEYTRNNRGDIGSRVRIGAMKTLRTFDLDLLTPHQFIHSLGAVLQQA